MHFSAFVVISTTVTSLVTVGSLTHEQVNLISS